MITEAQLDQVMGSTLYDRDGDKIGKVGQVYLDDDSGQPSWMTVNTGLFGTSESFVPLQQAELDDRGVRVPYEKGQVKDAPHASDDGHLDEAVQDQLYRHYGLDPSGAHEPVASPSPAAGAGGAGRDQAADAQRTDDRATVDRATGDRATGAVDRTSSPGPATTGGAAATSTTGSSEDSASTTSTSSPGSPSSGGARVDRSDDGELSGAAPGTAAGAVAGAAAGAAAGSARTAPRDDGPERGDRTGQQLDADARADQERADQEWADQERADQERADQERADQERAERDRADERRGRHASDGPVDGGLAPADAGGTAAAGASTQRPARMRLRRYVVTEQRTITVPVTHEEVRLERVDDDEPGDGSAVSEAEVVEIDMSDVDLSGGQQTSTGGTDRR